MNLDWVSVPEGAFAMGLDDARYDALCCGRVRYVESHRFSDARPSHERKLTAFSLQRAPMSAAMYQTFVDAVRAQPKEALVFFRELIAERGGRAAQDIMTRFMDSAEAGFGPNGPSPDPAAPVHGVSFFEAAACARFFGARLPTEAEWERAARYDDGRLLACGDNVARADVMNTREAGIGTPTPPDRFAHAVSALGLLDMAGNVWEWTSDLYASYPGGSYLVSVPPSARVARGGSYRDDAFAALTVARFPLDPWSRFAGLSFRLARG